MKLATKKKLFRILTPAVWTSVALTGAMLAGSIGGSVYYNNLGSRGEPQARAAEAQEVGEGFMRTTRLKEQYDKFASRHKELATAAQAAADPAQQSLAQSTLEMKYAYEKSVEAQTVQITHAENLSIADIREALGRLAKDNGSLLPGHIHALSERNSVNTFLHLCQKDVAAATPGFSPSPDSARAVAACALGYNNLSFRTVLGMTLAMFAISVTACMLGDKWKREITQEEREALRKLQQEQAALKKQQEALAALPPPPPKHFDPSTGEDITVKPIKIKSHAAPAAG